MTINVDRREMVRSVLCSAAAIALGLASVTEGARSAPLEIGEDQRLKPEKAVVVARRRRVRRCWWRRGRRICRWVWVR